MKNSLVVVFNGELMIALECVRHQVVTGWCGRAGYRVYYPHGTHDA